jgi:hypothetical protein
MEFTGLVDFIGEKRNADGTRPESMRCSDQFISFD